MAGYRMIITSAPQPGREDDYNRWYDDVHLGEVLAVPGFVRAQRFQLAATLAEGAAAAPYLAIYDIAGDDLAAPLAELRRRAGAGELTMSDAIDLSGVEAVIYAALGPPREG